MLLRLKQVRVVFRSLSILGAAWLFLAPSAATTEERFSSPSGVVFITGGPMEMKAVSVGGRVIPLGVHGARLVDKVGNLILIAINHGGMACPISFAWLNTTPADFGFSERFGTCAGEPEISYDRETVTVILSSANASEGRVAFIYDGSKITRQTLGLVSSRIAREALGNPEVWIDESPYEYLTALEHEAVLIEAIGWNSLDELRRAMTVGSQKMVVDGNWVVGSGCQAHMCATSYAAIALHRKTGGFIAAIKSDGVAPRLLGKPDEALPHEIRRILISQE